MRYEDNNWDSRSVIGLKKAARKSYSKLYFENKLPLIRVFIKRDTQPKGPKLECTVCIKDGRYYVAFDEEPFEEYLTNLKARIAR